MGADAIPPTVMSNWSRPLKGMSNKKTEPNEKERITFSVYIDVAKGTSNTKQGTLKFLSFYESNP